MPLLGKRPNLAAPCDQVAIPEKRSIILSRSFLDGCVPTNVFGQSPTTMLQWYRPSTTMVLRVAFFNVTLLWCEMARASTRRCDSWILHWADRIGPHVVAMFTYGGRYNFLWCDGIIQCGRRFHHSWASDFWISTSLLWRWFFSKWFWEDGASRMHLVLNMLSTCNLHPWCNRNHQTTLILNHHPFGGENPTRREMVAMKFAQMFGMSWKNTFFGEVNRGKLCESMGPDVGYVKIDWEKI